jgi:tripartite-type tricarboxylate transporter receptor subunit TctC
MKVLSKVAALVLVLATCAVQSAAQDYPNRPVRVIITFPAGSATDIVGRVIAQKLTEYWGQNVLADNRGGAGGSIGSAIGVRAAPDGYTLIINSNAHAVNPWLYAKLPYDTQKDFTDIAPLTATPNVLVDNVGAKVRTMSEFLVDARARSEKINFASAGVGSGTHLNLEKLKLDAQINVTHVPYKGTPEILTEVMGGRVDYYFCPLSACLPFIKEGKLRGIALSSLKRSELVPNLPTIAESGVPKFDYVLWFGLWGPARVPGPIVEKIRADVARALQSADVKERLTALANTPMDVSAKDFSKYIRQEMADIGRVIKAAGIQPQ